MFEEIIDFVKKNKLFVICLVIIIITYCNKKKSLENFSNECESGENDEFGDIKNERCEGVKNEEGINLNYCGESESACNLKNNDHHLFNNPLKNKCVECNYDTHCPGEYKICYKGKCEEMENENNEIIVGAKCNNFGQCGDGKYCKATVNNICLGTCKKIEKEILTCESNVDCEENFNLNGKIYCSYNNKCITEDHYNEESGFLDMKTNYKNLYNSFVKDEQEISNQNLKKLMGNIKPCLKNIVDEINNVKTYDIHKIKETKKKYLSKFSDFLNLVSENYYTDTEEMLLNKMREFFCPN